MLGFNFSLCPVLPPPPSLALMVKKHCAPKLHVSIWKTQPATDSPWNRMCLSIFSSTFFLLRIYILESPTSQNYCLCLQKIMHFFMACVGSLLFSLPKMSFPTFPPHCPRDNLLTILYGSTQMACLSLAYSQRLIASPSSIPQHLLHTSL